MRTNLVDIVTLVSDGSKVHTAAKRGRLTALHPLILLIVKESPDLSLVPPEALPAGATDVVNGMIAELVLCTKEVNQKTRTQAYSLLVDLSHAVHAAKPPILSMDMDIGASQFSLTLMGLWVHVCVSVHLFVKYCLQHRSLFLCSFGCIIGSTGKLYQLTI